MEKYNYNQLELFTYRDIFEQLTPDGIYEFIKDANQRIADDLAEIVEIKQLIALANDVLSGYGEDYEDMKKRDI